MIFFSDVQYCEEEIEKKETIWEEEENHCIRVNYGIMWRILLSGSVLQMKVLEKVVFWKKIYKR